ncbi:hypothetical protein HZC00_00105 [Candidatus Kaiserbacteria bacterium]|nr:hypothetical protein [Candidatus Kaiserbacteria bacterium]
MQTKIALGAVLCSTLFAGGFVFAQEGASTTAASDPSQGGPKITFPIAELGNCNSKDECKAYCDDSTHADACLAFGERTGLMKKEEVAQARSLAKQRGPGNCQGLACKKYCDDPSHADECIAFAKEHNLISAKDVQIAQVIKSGAGPGGCDSMSSCWNYCSDTAHGDECSRFARDNGLEPPRQGKMPPGVPSREEIDQRFKHDEPKIDEEKAMQVLSQKGGPGGCKTMDECKNFCDQESNMKVCMAFAEENNLMSTEDVARAKKFMDKPGPGGCRGNACRTYCEDQSHMDECTALAVENGFMSKDEAERVKKFRDMRGPGGCKAEECKTYCEDSSHRDECTAFAIQNGFMTQEEADRMKGMQNMAGPGGCKGEECRTYCEDSSHRDECVAFAKERGMMGTPPGEGRNSPDRPLPPEGSASSSYQGEGDRGQRVEGGLPADPRNREYMPMTGPGGCKSRTECEEFCKSNPDQCKPNPGMQNARPQQEQGMPPQDGIMQPPANMTPEQQQKYEEYKKMMQEKRQQSMQGAPVRDPGQYREYPDDRPMPQAGQDQRPEMYRQYQSGSMPGDMQRPQPPYPQQQYQGPQGTQPGMMPPQPYQNQTMPSDPRYQQYQGQYQQPPAGGEFQGASAPSMPPPPPVEAPTSMRPYNLVASVFYAFSQLLQGF